MPYIKPEARCEGLPVLLARFTVEVPDTCLVSSGLATAADARTKVSNLYMIESPRGKYKNICYQE